MTTMQKIRPYLWLAFMAVTLSGGLFFFFRFTSSPFNTVPATRGLAIASTIWCTVLMVAMFLHKSWARYVLIVWLVASMLVFGLTALLMNKSSLVPLEQANRDVLIGLAFYAATLTPLGVSRSLRRHLAPRTAGGR